MKWVLLVVLAASFVVDQRAQDTDIANSDSGNEVLWLNPEEPSGLVLSRPPRPGVERGSVLVVANADGGPGASTHSTAAYQQLPFHGWRTYYARVPYAPMPQARGPAAAVADSQAMMNVLPDGLAAALLGYAQLVRARSQGTLVLIAEGGLGEACVALLERLQVDGLVLIDLPVDTAQRNLLQALSVPSLVLQESPNHWPKENPLGPDVELHLLSRVDARRQDNRLLRKIRGWFKRRFVEA